ncbi:MAG: helix-turn-helix domain-containing protein [Ramlibacter sp.]
MTFQLESSTPLTPVRDVRRELLPAVPAAFGRTRGAAPGGAIPLCRGCQFRALCIPQGLTDRELQDLDQVVLGRRHVRKGESLFLQGEPFTSMHAVRVGCFKSSMTLSDGKEQVTGFAFAGDVLGFDAFATGVHSTTATALEDGEACVFSYEAMMTLASGSGARGGLRRRVDQMLGEELTREQWLMTLIAHTNSEPRVAAFLLLLSRRMRERGFSGTEFHLRMSRAEVGSYLGLSVESVSRALSAFADRKLIEVRRRDLRLLDLEAIARVSESALPGSCQGFARWEPGMH